MYCVLCGKKRRKFWDVEYRICTQKCADSLTPDE